MDRRSGALVLKDGTVLLGEGLGAAVVSTGEVVFHTALTGYPEILTDPSYAGQMVCLTQTQVGNYGVTLKDLEAQRPHAMGLVVRAVPEQVSNWRSQLGLGEFLLRHGLPGLSGVDTRALVTHLRTGGSQPGVLWTGEPGATANVDALLAHAKTLPSMHGQEWVSKVTCAAPYEFQDSVDQLSGEPAAFGNALRGQGKPHVVALDYGVKLNILRLLVASGCRVTVVPAHTTAAEILARQPQGVFLSNGPGDPAACGSMVNHIEHLLGKVPIFGICLGHQLLARAVGASTYKLKFGHRGGNQPVQNVLTGKIHITSQNHGFAVDPGTLPNDVTVSDVNLSDGTVEGIHLPKLRAFGVQYHPEAAPGPHDTRHHFTAFGGLMRGQPLEGDT